jgi:hypothetical protein
LTGHSASTTFYDQQLDGQDELISEGLLAQPGSQVERGLLWSLPPEPTPAALETVEPADQAIADTQTAAQDESAELSGEGDRPEEPSAQRDGDDQRAEQDPSLEGNEDSPPSKSAVSTD